MLSPEVTQATAPVGLADFDQPAERVEGCCNVGCLLGYDHEMIVLAVVGERGAKAVEDPPTQRRDEPQIHTVLVREHRVAIRFQDLQLVHAPGDSGEKGCLTSCQD